MQKLLDYIKSKCLQKATVKLFPKLRSKKVVVHTNRKVKNY